MAKQIGFIGLGIMGGHMVRNLARKFPRIRVFDIEPQKIEAAVVTAGVAAAASVEEVGRDCNVVLLSLPSSSAVKAVVVGPRGLSSSMQRGGVVIDTSTTEIAAEIEIAATLKEIGIDFLDAPVSGGEEAAAKGTLSFMVGGDETVFQTCKEYLAALGASVIRTGNISMGQVAKCVNQMIVGATFAVVAESFALGTQAGLNPKILYEAIKGGWAGSKLLDISARDMFSREFKPGGTVDIHWKDLGYALSLSKEKDVPIPVTALVHEIFTAARAAGHGKCSQAVVVRLWENLMGTEVK
jgi:2-hydroxy-3-oxopropionate reductase